jgi:Flp pilus assembly protein TadD
MKKFQVWMGWLLVSAATITAAMAVRAADEPAASNGNEHAAALADQANEKLGTATTPEEYQAAADLLHEALTLDPNNLDVQFTLGWVYLDKLHDPQAAYRHLAVVVKWRGQDVNARKLFGMACSQTGRMDEAVEQFRKAAALDPTDLWIQANLARSLARSGHWVEADRIYTEILARDPSNADALVGQAELQAWRGESARPLATLAGVVKQNPTNADALILMGDINRWNWRLTDARMDYQAALAVNTNAADATKGIQQAQVMGAPNVSGNVFYFKDKTQFQQESAGGDAAIPLGDGTFLTAGGDEWRFNNPGFEDVFRVDGHAGLDVHWNRWLETAASGQSFNELSYQGEEHSFVGAQGTAKISLTPGRDLYLAGGYNQPFVSDMLTVTNSMKQTSGGGGLDFKLFGPFSVQDSFVESRVSDGNHWLEEKPQLSIQVFNVPGVYIRGQYDYLHYAETKSTYWTPGSWRVASPILSLSLPLGGECHLAGDASAPYVLNVNQFGYQFDGGPVLELTRWVEIKASGIYSYIPGPQVTWSGSGVQGSILIRF